MDKDHTINDEDLFVRIVNKAQAENKKESESVQESTREDEPMVSENQTARNKSNKVFKSLHTRICAFALAFSIGTGLGAVGTTHIKNKNAKDNFVREYFTSIQTVDIKKMLDAGIAYMDENGKLIIKNNDAEQYAEVLGIQDNEPERIVAIEKLFSDKSTDFVPGTSYENEFDNVIQSISYDNGMYHYTDRLQYLRINGADSYIYLENRVEAEMLEAYDEGVRIYDDGVLTYSYTLDMDGSTMEETSTKAR